jgi:hypothetical protein
MSEDLLVNINQERGDLLCTNLEIENLIINENIYSESGSLTFDNNLNLLNSVTTNDLVVINGTLLFNQTPSIDIYGNASNANSTLDCLAYSDSTIGDVTGGQTSTLVQGIRNVPVNAAIPNNGDSLTYLAGQYVPLPAPVPSIVPTPVMYSSVTVGTAPGIPVVPVQVAVNDDLFIQEYDNLTRWWKLIANVWVLKTTVSKAKSRSINILTTVNPLTIATPSNPPLLPVAGDRWTEIYSTGWYTYIYNGVWSIQSVLGLPFPRLNSVTNTLNTSVNIAGSVGSNVVGNINYQCVTINNNGAILYSDQTPNGAFPAYNPLLNAVTFNTYTIAIGDIISNQFYSAATNGYLLASSSKTYSVIKFTIGGAPVGWNGAAYDYTFIVESDNVVIASAANATTYISAKYPEMFIDLATGYFTGMISSITAADIPVFNTNFITRWTTTAPAQTVQLPINGTVAINVDWGDGSSSFENTLPIQHVYAAAGSYDIDITGSIDEWDHDSLPVMYKNVITNILQFGQVGLTKLNFSDETLLGPILATDVPQNTIVNMSKFMNNCAITNIDTTSWDTTNVTDFSYMFNGAPLATPNTTNWDTANVTDFSYMFAGASLAAPDTTNWDTSNATNFEFMFNAADKAAPITSSWNTTNVTNMASMFNGAVVATPNTTNWDVSNVTNMSSMFANMPYANPNVTNWDTSSVTDMSEMFQNALEADPDVSGWDTSNVTTLSGMFQNTLEADPDVSGWDTSNVTDMSNVFAGAVGTDPYIIDWVISPVLAASIAGLANMFNLSAIEVDNYSETLEKFNNETTANSVQWGTINAYYLDYVAAARTNLLTVRFWVFTDLGPEI